MYKIIRKIEEVLRSPHKTPKHTKVVCVEITDKTQKEIEVTMHHNEIELIETLNKLQNGLKLYGPTMNELWDKIRSYGDYRYSQGVEDQKNSELS